MMQKKQFQTLEFNQNAYESKMMIETLNQEVPVKEKLQEILATLLLEAEDNRKEFCKTKLEFETRIKQKDSIIQCLVKVNGSLVDENQKLQKKISKSIHQFRQKFIQSKENFSKQKQEMISVIKYLESRNERLLHQIYCQTYKNRKSQGLLSPMRIQTHPGWSVNQNIPFSEKQQKLLGKIDPQSTIFSRCTSSNHLYDLKQNQKSSQKKIFYSKQTTPIIKQQINSPKTNKNSSKLRAYKSSIFQGHRKLVFDNL